eukprot:gene2090-1962_t
MSEVTIPKETLPNRHQGETIDLKDEFHNPLVHEKDRALLGFVIDNTRYEFKSLPQGLKLSSTLFHGAIDNIFTEEQKGFTLRYVDDLLVTSDTVPINVEKLEINVTKLNFLGHEITFSKDGVDIKPDSAKLIHLETMEKLQTLQHVQRVYGSLNYLRNYVYRFSEMTHPITQLMKGFIRHVLNCNVSYAAVRQVVLSCDRCRPSTKSPYTLRQPFKSFVAEYPMQKLVGNILYMNENDDEKAIVCIIDMFTKYCWL